MVRSRLLPATMMAVLVSVALAGCSGPIARVPEPTGDVPLETIETSVYFSTGRTLYEEPVLVDAADKYQAVADELLAASPKSNMQLAIVQPTAKLRSVTFKDGTVTLDWDGDVLSFEAEDPEQTLALAAFLMTYGQFPEVKKVAFTVEGKAKGTLDGRDIQKFWGRVSLRGSPWDVLASPKSRTETGSAEPTTGGE